MSEKNNAQNQQQQQQAKPQSSGDPKYDALVAALNERGISTAFLTSDENWRKRALKFDTPESEYEKMKEEHKWLFDQPIRPVSKEEREQLEKEKKEEEQAAASASTAAARRR